MRYIDISSIDNLRNVVKDTKRFKLVDAPSRARQVVRSGDTLFSTVRPYLRNIALVRSCFDQEIASTGFSVLRPAKGICPEFLFYKAISSDFVDSLSGKQYGVSYPAVTDEQVRDQELWLPPTAEQYRIVAKIHELFSELDPGIESLKKAGANLKSYRQALLKDAFEGRLTEEWRSKDTERGKSASAIFSRIRQEREANQRERLGSWRVALRKWEQGGRETQRPSRPHSSVAGASLSPDEMNALPVLPDRWTWCRVDEVGQVQLGRQRSPKHATGLYMRPYLRVANVFESRIDISDVYSMNFTPREFKVYELKPSDILLNEGQSLELVGRPAMFNGEVSGCCFQNTLIRFRPEPGLDARYALQLFVHYLKSGRFRKIARWTNNIAHLGAKRFADLEFPLCPLPEQQEIVRILDETFVAVERIEQEIDVALEQVRTLKQSILKLAFSGRLVRQDPDYQPASGLLDRIRAERDQVARQTKGRIVGRRKQTKVIV